MEILVYRLQVSRIKGDLMKSVYSLVRSPRIQDNALRSTDVAVSGSDRLPTCKVAAKLAIGFNLDEIGNDVTKETPYK